MSIVVLDDGIRRGQTEAAALPFGCEVGIEYPLKMFVGDSCPLISNNDMQISSWRQGQFVGFDDLAVMRLQEQSPTIWHRLVGIDDEILSDLADLSTVDLSCPEIVVDVKFARHIRTTRRKCRRVSQQVHHRCSLLHGGATFGKCQELMGEIRRPVCGGFDLRQMIEEPTLRLDLSFHQGEIPDDGGEDVVEVVGDPSCHDAERLELLCLEKLLFHLPLRCHVPGYENHADRLALVIANRCCTG